MRLTQRAKPLLSGGESLMLREVSRTTQKSVGRSVKPSLESADQPLFDALRALRKSLADERGVPPYVIFHDKTLYEMIASLPTNLSEMADISGVGEQKLERFGESFLSVIRDHQVQRKN